MENEWFNNSEYWADIEEIRKSMVKNAMTAETEAQTAAGFQRPLGYYIRLRTGKEVDFKQETPIKEGVSYSVGKLKKRTSGTGKLDAVVNNLIIEYKKYSKLDKKSDQEIAIDQVKGYLNALLESNGIKYNAILTDGIKIAYIGFSGNVIETTSFKTIEAKDIDRIIHAILANNCKKFIPENILTDFAIDVNVKTKSRTLAINLYRKLTLCPTEKTKMLYLEWENLMHLSYDDNGKGNDIAKRREILSLIFEDDIDDPVKEYQALFALQTSYAIIVKLIACKVVDRLDDFDDTTRKYFDLTKITSLKLQSFLEKLEDGYGYRSSNIINFLEGDFFSWYSAKEQWDETLGDCVKEIIKLIDGYTTFSFEIKYNPIDIFKDLYMSIIPKAVRHSMGEYFTPAWLADYVVAEGIKMQKNLDWKAIDPCCGSGTFIITLIKHIVGDVDLYLMTEEEKEKVRNKILNSVYGIDINPLSVLSARVGYYLALRPFGELKDIEIPIYLGDSAITPTKEIIDGIICYKYSISNYKKAFDVVLPARLVKQKNFSKIMSSFQVAVKNDNGNMLFDMIKRYLSEDERKSGALMLAIKSMVDNLIELHQNKWDGIWLRIATNFMLIARLENFDLIVGNPPWVKWEHLPSKYADKIKELCNMKHIFSTRGRFGGTQLNICALISNVVATNWLKDTGVLAFLMPDSIMSQNSYEEFRYFYTDYEKNERLYLQKIDKWEKPLKPFSSEGMIVSQDFNTYYYSRNIIDYAQGIDVTTISRKKEVTDCIVNKEISFEAVKKHLTFGMRKACQISEKTSAFSYLSDKYDFRKIIGNSSYEFRTGVEFTPQELYMLKGNGVSSREKYYKFKNKRFSRSKYIVDDAPRNGWDLPTDFIYPIVTGPSLSPFKANIENEFCIVPYKEEQTDNPVDMTTLLSTNEELFYYLLNHKNLIDSQSEKSKAMHRGEEFYALSKIGPYTFAKYIVAARDNTKFCAAVIRKKDTPWGEKKQSICVKHTIIIGRTIEGRYIEENEAYYISGILNSDIVVEYIQNSFKSNGYSLKKAHIYLPEYDKNNGLHIKISELAKEASHLEDNSKIKDIQKEISNLYLDICEEK